MNANFPAVNEAPGERPPNVIVSGRETPMQRLSIVSLCKTSQAEVAARCGQPTQIDRQTLYSEGGAAGLPGGPRPAAVRRCFRELPGDRVVRFLERIHFENGVVVKIESLGCGF